MQQTTNCPSCGSPLAPNQKFCGVCGLNLAGIMQQKATACSTCGSSIAPGQQFCGVCGTKLPIMSQQPPLAQPAQAGTTIVRGAPAAQAVARPRKHGILRTAAVIFQIFGWIVLVFGILVSIGVAVWAGMGGAFQSLMPGMETVGGVAAIGMAIGGIIASLLYGYGFLAFAEICYAIIEIQKDLE
jgi:hypothetical protein